VPSNPTPIKAVHPTTDTPAIATLGSTPEPGALDEIENAIAAPHPSPGAEPLLSAEQELSAMPERIGYLKELCGLDYGWGPTALMEFAVEHLHIYGGLTWAVSIAGSAVLIRLFAFRPSCQSSDMAVRMKQAGPILEPLRKEYKEVTLANDTVKKAQVAAQMSMITQEYNISYGKVFLPMLIQIPLSFGGFRLFRGMAALPVPAFETEKWLWMSDLTHSDPLCILPLISAASLYLSMRVSLVSSRSMRGFCFPN
jgi:YidC/Oxa1 family membrane protein insertase